MMTTMEEQVSARAKTLFERDSSGHDFAHSLRVYKTAVRIAAQEKCDGRIVALAALLHDADDVKLFHTENLANARRIMSECGVSAEDAERVAEVIGTVSFKGTDSQAPATIEGQIVQDADRLDAIGAIGIARVFAYGGAAGRAMYDPENPPTLGMNEQAYRASKSTSINHFYEKLLLLRDLLNTPAARKIAEGRQKVMEDFLTEFYAEWNGEK